VCVCVCVRARARAYDAKRSAGVILKRPLRRGGSLPLPPHPPYPNPQNPEQAFAAWRVSSIPPPPPPEASDATTQSEAGPGDASPAFKETRSDIVSADR
jgi:hypothetical protein